MDDAHIAALKDSIANFRIVDERVCRGAQPDEAAYPLLAQAGVGLVIKLNSEIPMEEKLVEDTGMRFFGSSMSGWGRPHDLQVNNILDKLIQEVGRNTVVFVHCHKGDDRTGVIIGCYRIKHWGWTNHEALKEAATDGMSWAEVLMHDFVEDYHIGTD